MAMATRCVRPLEELIEEDEGIDQQSRPEFSDEERAILLNALSFGSLQVWDVMVPRSDIKSIESDADLDQVISTMRESAHTRLPVIRDTQDDIIGMVHLERPFAILGGRQGFQASVDPKRIAVYPAFDESSRSFDENA